MDVYVWKNFLSVWRLCFINYVYCEYLFVMKMVLELDNLGYRVEYLLFDFYMFCLVKNLEFVLCFKKYFLEVILFCVFLYKFFLFNVLIVDWCFFEVFCLNIDYIL